MNTLGIEQEASPNGSDHEPADVVDAPRFDKQSWLDGPGDLDEVEVHVDAIGGSVTVRALTAGQLATVQDQCLHMKNDVMKVDSQRMAVLKFARGVIEPQFTEDEANVIAHKFGRSFNLVVGVIDEISKASEEDVQKARRRFRPRR